MDTEDFLFDVIETYREAVDDAAYELVQNACEEFITYADEQADEIQDTEELCEKLSDELRYIERTLCVEITGKEETQSSDAIGDFSERFQYALDMAIASDATHPFETFRLDGKLKITINTEE